MKTLYLLLALTVLLGIYFVVEYYQERPVEEEVVTKESATSPEVPPRSPLFGTTMTVPQTDGRTVRLTETTPPPTSNPRGTYEADGGARRGGLVALAEHLTYTETGAVVPIVLTTSDSDRMTYVALLEQLGDRFTHATSVPLGDQIDLRSVRYDGTQIVVDYYTPRFAGSATATASPRVATAHIDVTTGDAALLPASSTPTMAGTYRWEETIAPDGAIINPASPAEFQLLLRANNTIFLETDCNTLAGNYSYSSDGRFSLADLTRTELACPNSQDEALLAALLHVSRYSWQESGDLQLRAGDGTTITFTRR